jgi:hypothetical protein
MTTKPNLSAIREYEKTPFILTDRKISRIVEVARERLDRVKGEQQIDEDFVVTFKNDKELKVDSLDKVLALDNSSKNSIENLNIRFVIPSESDSNTSIRILFKGGNLDRNLIRLASTSSDLGWLQETMGALEEQLERAIPTDIIYTLKKLSMLPILMVAYLVVMLPAMLMGNLETKVGPMKIPQEQVVALTALQSTAKTEQEKIDFVFNYLSATLSGEKVNSVAWSIFSDYRTYLTGVPLIIGLLSAVSAIIFFYPTSLFAWGDCGEAYDKTVERRTFIWYGVVASLVIGVLGNFFVLGVTSWHPN